MAIYSRTTTGLNTMRYVREDREGSVAAILASDGTSYVKESFDAFGARRSACTWSGLPTSGTQTRINAVTRHGYTWQTALGAMGLNDMNGRIQDAITGRFLSADPYIKNPLNPQNYNRYSYVNNNPLSYIDPTGFEATDTGNEKPIEPIDPDSGKADGATDTSQVTIQGLLDNSRFPPQNNNPLFPTNTPVPLQASQSGGGSGGGPMKTITVTTRPPKAPVLPTPSPTIPPPFYENGGSGPQGNQKPQGPCSGAANAPSPQQYAAQGAALQAQVNRIGLLPPQFALMAPVTEADVLLNFRRGSSLDAQMLYGGSQAYGNYAFGVFMAAAGFSLQATLNGANAYGAFASQYSANQLAGSEATGYPSIPPANVANVTAGFNAQQSGSLCTKP